MSTFSRSSGLVSRICALPLAFFCLMGFSTPASAQTAPQLLPYLPKVLAGGGVALTQGAPCPDATGNHSLDAYGDGCLATSVLLTSPRYAVSDSAGNVFFSDYATATSLIRRIDAVTGIVTLVGGGVATSPTTGVMCGAFMSLDNKGDGCLANAVSLFNPENMKFAANGDLYFVENGNQDVRKIAATNGLITTSGVISLVAGNVAKPAISGYAVNQGSTTITPGPGSTASLLDFPADIAFDQAGNLYIADEGNQALEVVNLTSATETIQGVTVPAGTIAKLAGYGVAQTKTATGECPNGQFMSTSNRGGCYFGTYTPPAVAITSNLDSPYAVALDSAGNVYFDNEFPEEVGKLSGGLLTNFAGNGNTTYTFYKAGNPFPRGAAGSFAIGSNFGLAFDNQDNAYITDAFYGVIWRVDKSGTMYVVAGGSFTPPAAHTPCPGASTFTSLDAFGDGCPATSAVFGKSGTSFATSSSPGIDGVSVDAASNLYVGDSITGLIREVGNGTNLGTNLTSTILVHYVAGDSPAANAYVVTAGASLFNVTPGNCIPNTDGTQDCPVTINGTPTVLGPYNGQLTIASTNGGSVTYALSGIFAPTPVTRTTASVTLTACNGASTIAVGTPVTLNAVVISTGTATGTVQFFANGAAIGAPQPLSSTGTASYTFSPSTVNTFTITATYSGDSYFQTSTGQASTTFTTSAPTFSLAVTTNGVPNAACPTGPTGMVGQCTVKPGQTALYSITVNQTVYSGTVNFAVTGLPANTSYAFSPTQITANGCTTTSTVALSIFTTQPGPIAAGGFGGTGRGAWQAFGILPGVLLALFVGIRRRKSPLRYGQVWMSLALLLAASGLMACGKGASPTAGTAPGNYTITITATGSVSPNPVPAPITVPLTVVAQ